MAMTNPTMLDSVPHDHAKREIRQVSPLLVHNSELENRNPGP